MSNLKASLVDTISTKCIEVFKNISKNGKPIAKEWTVLSCVVQYDTSLEQIEVVSLGTGSKCIGASLMSPRGDLLNDSHAEVFARRGFLLYIYDNIEKTLNGKNTIFTFENGKLKLKSNLRFIFYSSQLPCGDASIISKDANEEHFGDLLQNGKRQANDDVCESEIKKQKLSNAESDIHRTGAKCLPHNEQDLKCPGPKYHLLSQVRTKPGRGDRTLSVSCSDKIARWIHVGIQGALLDMVLHEPIYIDSFIFGGGVPYSEESLVRALLKRDCATSDVKLKCVPQFFQTSVVFPHIRTENNIRPAPGSIVCIKLDNVRSEVAVQGRKLGATKKKSSLLCNSLCISKYNLYRRFLEVMKKGLDKNIEGFNHTDDLPYNAMKRKSIRYLEAWAVVKKKFFQTWTVKPDIWNFCVSMSG